MNQGNLKTDDSFEWDIFKSLLELEEKRINTCDSTGQAIRYWSITISIALAGFVVKTQTYSLCSLIVISAFIFSMADFAYRKVQLYHVKRSLILKNEISNLQLTNQIIKKLYQIRQTNPNKTSFSHKYIIFSTFFNELLYWPITYILEIFLALFILFCLLTEPSNSDPQHLKEVRDMTLAISIMAIVVILGATAFCSSMLRNVTALFDNNTVHNGEIN